MTNYRIAFHTLGCKTNHYETDVIASQFRMHGFKQVPFQSEADVYLINTCTVTGEADRKSRQMLRRAKQRNPKSVVVAMGCHAELSNAAQYADICIGTQGKGRAVAEVLSRLENRNHRQAYQQGEAAGSNSGKHSYEEFTEYEELGISGLQSETRAYLKIEDGCNAFCSYCAIPLARGRVRSRDESQILEEAAVLAKAGYKEIVLTGIHLCSYGSDRQEPEHAVALLAARLARVHGLERIRLGSLEPLSVTSEFLDTLLSSDKICPHFHLSLQSGCDRTLRAMNRRYQTSQFRNVVSQIRRRWPQAGITTDIITGFPGETDEDFRQSLEFCREMAFSRMHIFRFSPREGTKAAGMSDQVDPAVSAARSQQMQKLADEIAAGFHRKLKGQRIMVLTEKTDSKGCMTGYTDSYIPVRIYDAKNIAANTLVEVEVVDTTADFVAGRAVNQN